MKEKNIKKEVVLQSKDKLAVLVMLPAFVAVLIAALILKEKLLDPAVYGARERVHGISDISIYLIAAGLFLISYAVLFVDMLINYREGLLSKRVFAVAGTSTVLNFLFCMGASYLSIYFMPLCFASIIVSFFIDRKVGFTVNIVCVLQALVFVLLEIGRSGDSSTLFPFFVMAGSSVCFNIISAGRINQNAGRAGFIGWLFFFSLILLPVSFIQALLYSQNLKTFGSDVLWIAAGIGTQIVLVLFFMPLLERLFMITTNGRLAELCDLRHPLLKRLLREAPATFNHSQAVSNLAESCAAALNLNPYIARAAALYHDIGKLTNVEYFTENQPAGQNPHDHITPELSVEIIRKHTYDGFKMAMDARLPKDVAAITKEHHGTAVIRPFYEKAKRMTDGEVSMELYRHTCDKPSSKIAAIVMICDSSEAAIHSMTAPDQGKVAEVVGSIIYDRLLDGQFDNCEITMQDLALIKKTIGSLSTGLQYTRVEYPKWS